jgi:spermidine/putrescine transport system permease protein
LGTGAQVLGLVTYQIAYPAVLVRTRLATIGAQYEEAATDLGASPLAAPCSVTRRRVPPCAEAALGCTRVTLGCV